MPDARQAALPQGKSTAATAAALAATLGAPAGCDTSIVQHSADVHTGNDLALFHGLSYRAASVGALLKWLRLNMKGPSS